MTDTIRAVYARRRAVAARHTPFGQLDAEDLRIVVKRTAQECGVEVEAVEAALEGMK
ncbi:MAG: hypothetical protein KGL63_01710 [Betaproteobacteria bacterium]|nr:hypothetical protein [Betaproteobacteria bacterium]